jgi:hypothetical protein
MASVKDKKGNKGSLAAKAKARANEPVSVGAEEVVKAEAQDRISAPSPLPTQLKAPLPDYAFIRSYAKIPALRKAGIQGGGQ